MSFAQTLFLCFATWMIFNLWKLALAHARQKTRQKAPLPILAGVAVIGVALCLGTNSVAAQETEAIADSGPAASEAAPAVTVINPSNSILGFETLGAWSVRTDKADPKLTVQLTTDRTQGNAAYIVSNPPALFGLESHPVNSTAKALAGIGNQGALLQIDVLARCANILPIVSEKCLATKDGFIEGFVTSKSRGLNDVSLGKVSLSKDRPGIYNTVSFEIPEEVSSALDHAEYNDLIFEFVIGAADNVDGSYLFDNLRVQSVEMIQDPNGQAPPASYGGSLNLTVDGNTPVKQAFALSPIQIPSGLHLKQGTTGTTSVQLEAGLDSSTSFSCTYVPDPSDVSGQSYKVSSCTNGYEAGDIVNANSISLAIKGGQISQQLFAQFVLGPLGSQTGAGLIPPMPTFWGNSDACTPAPVAGKVMTISTSCANQAAETNQIVTNYFNQMNSANPPQNWIVTPVPESAIRRADGTPTDQLAGKPAVAPADDGNDLTFNDGGDLNPGGSFDAYWKLSGDLDPTAVAGTNENLTHFDAEFTAHGVLFGEDVDVVDAQLTADTDSGETVPASKPATSSGSLDFFVFGEEIPSGGLNFNPSLGFNIDPKLDEELDLPPIQISIFTLTLGADVEADLSVQGSAALSGADLSATPNVSLNANFKGGVDIGIAQGDVDANVNLVKLSTPVSAQAQWDLDTKASICAALLTGSLDGNLDISSGGGSVDLDATLGPCPLCHTISYTLFKWPPLASENYNLFNDTFNAPLFPLPESMCSYSINVSIQSPSSGAVLSSTLPITLTGLAAPTDPTVASTATYSWTFTPGANASTATVSPLGANGPNPTVTFGPPTSGNTSTWTINLTATTTVNSSGGRVLTQTASATPVTIQVTNLPAGIVISQVSSANNGPAIPSDGILQLGNLPGTITVSGVVTGATGALNTTFSVAPCSAVFRGTCIGPGNATVLTATGAATPTPSATWTGFEGGIYEIVMNTTAGGSLYGTDTVLVSGSILQ
jgi:hypothetical protein